MSNLKLDRNLKAVLSYEKNLVAVCLKVEAKNVNYKVEGKKKKRKKFTTVLSPALEKSRFARLLTIYLMETLKVKVLSLNDLAERNETLPTLLYSGMFGKSLEESHKELSEKNAATVERLTKEKKNRELNDFLMNATSVYLEKSLEKMLSLKEKPENKVTFEELELILNSKTSYSHSGIILTVRETIDSYSISVTTKEKDFSIGIDKTSEMFFDLGNALGTIKSNLLK
jgi:hypothetical protein